MTWPAQPTKDRFEQQAVQKQPNGCWLWTGTRDSKGYGVMKVRVNRKPKMMKAHRIALMIHQGFEPSPQVFQGQKVLHSCDNPPCVNPDHLRLGTDRDNILDKFKRGRGPTQKLTFQEIREIQATATPGRKAAYGELVALSKKYDISVNHVYCIRKGVNWSYL